MSFTTKSDERAFSTLNAIAREAGDQIMALYSKALEMTHKGTWDFKTEADDKSQALIVNRLTEANLGYGIVAEETPVLSGSSEKGVIYVDPLEGTHNFARMRSGFGFGVTLGLVTNHTPVYVVFYNPVSRELCTATKGGGAYINSARVHVSEVQGTNRQNKLDILFNHWPDLKHVGGYLDKLRTITEYTPTSASDAVDMWMVASGKADGLLYIFDKADPWDLLHALAIEEAGGVVTNLDGGPWFENQSDGSIQIRGSMIAGSSYVHNLIFKNVQ